MKWLATLVLGALIGAGAVFYFLSKVPIDAPPAASRAGAPAAGVALPQVSLPAVRVPPLAADGAAGAPAGAGLLIPVAGIDAGQLADTFSQARGGERRHEALDIAAPRGSEVLAVADGRVAKLFDSKPGGLTVYHFDPGEKYAYYYAHLERYAAGLAEGQQLRRGQVIGYVGTSGNADPATPHLHFAVFELGPEKQWWKGTPVNPYPLLAGAGQP